MSAYTTQAAVLGEIRRRDLIALTDDDKTGDIDSTVLNQVIASSSGYIDSKLANIYGAQLPFNPIPSSVANMALTIACYRLFRRAEVPDEKNKFYESWQDVKDFLDRVNKGDAMIDDVIDRDYSQVAFNARNTTFGVAGTNFPSTTI